MKQVKIYFGSLIFIILLGCSNNVKENSDVILFSKFPIELHPKFEEIEVVDELFFVGDIMLLKDALVTLDMKASPFFQVFSLPDFSHKGGFVTQGNGPEEELMIAPKLTRLDDNTFYYRTINNIKIAQYLPDKGQLVVRESIPLSNEAMGLSHSILLGNYIYGYGFSIPSPKEFVGFSRATGEIIDFGPDYPITNMNIKDTNKANLFSKVLGVRVSGGDRFAALYDKFPILRIYGRNGQLIKDIRYENNQINPSVYLSEQINIDLLNKTMVNYQKIAVTDSYIYGLYAGKTHGELETQKLQIDDFCNEIHIWDWDGNPKAKLVLPQKVFSFSVSLQDEYLLFSSIRSEDRVFRVYLSL